MLIQLASSMKLTAINSEKAPEPVGPYSQAIQSDRIIFCSGQIGLDPKTNKLVTGGIEAETKQVLENLLKVLEAAGSSKNHVVQTTIFIADMNDFSKVNEIYANFFNGEIKPARQTIEVSKLPKGALIEISCIGVLKD